MQRGWYLMINQGRVKKKLKKLKIQKKLKKINYCKKLQLCNKDDSLSAHFPSAFYFKLRVIFSCEAMRVAYYVPSTFLPVLRSEILCNTEDPVLRSLQKVSVFNLKWPLLQSCLETFTVAPRERERRLP